MIERMTATELSIRKSKARDIAAFVMRELEDYLAVSVKREAYYNLITGLEAIGADFITDAMRAEMGLPPRDANGWTREDLHALEAHRLAMLMRPIMVQTPCDLATNAENRTVAKEPHVGRKT